MTFDSGTMRATSGPHRARRYSPPVAPEEQPFGGAETVDDLTEWVESGSSDEEVADRASQVLDAETAKDSPRSTLVSKMEGILDAATAASVDADDEEQDEAEPES